MNGALIYLIVDDDADDREFFREAVAEINSSSVCLMADNGAEALRKLRSGIKHLPDYIFLDLNMHLMDGRKCLVELKKDINLKNIPVIILTTSSAQKDIDETRNLGASDFLTKPSEYQKLRSEIIAVTQKDRSPQPYRPTV
ncbi:response regulator [Dyadobacter psychrotolerans]|uniref:Response regulator n=1 Tax=Dyadobacter psychrotolerans TaxID=2541721 RepID=A0A4R5DHZ4_9BACT|nr:response regulator [Dyadobacter psychrotolerans]TDE11551.1 response regulator [Dyadobacter psychrotolerans]